MVSLFIKQSTKHIAEQDSKDAKEAKRKKNLETIQQKASEDAETDDVVILMNDDWEDMPTAKDELDLNDELFLMQDM
jgi:hypothetical protein